MSQPPFYDLSARRLDGTSEPLANYRGRVALVVNTASECGYTPQYGGLERLYRSLRDRGFVVLGFPSNDFGGQEPGSPQEIAEFCSTRYQVDFPLFGKIQTRGPGCSEIYAVLAAEQGPPKWNFHKYLIDKHGKVVAAYPSSVEPEDPDLTAAIERLLEQP